MAPFDPERWLADAFDWLETRTGWVRRQTWIAVSAAAMIGLICCVSGTLVFLPASNDLPTATFAPLPPATSVAIYQNYTLAKNAGVQNPVPYIVDHGPGGEISSSFAYARPYYALWWEAVQGNDKTRLNNTVTVRFMQIPAIVSLQVNPNGTATLRFRPTSPSVNPTQLYLGVSPTPTATPTP